MHIAEVVTIAKSLPLLRLNTYKSLILSYSADYRRIFEKNYSKKHADLLFIFFRKGMNPAACRLTTDSDHKTVPPDDCSAQPQSRERRSLIVVPNYNNKHREK